MIPALETALENISIAIGLVGVLILFYGALHAIYRIIKIEAVHRKRFHHYEHAKRVFAQKIIFALDFFVAADLLRLAVAVSMEEIVSIAFIVAIRTVLSWSLSREVHLHKE